MALFGRHLKHFCFPFCFCVLLLLGGCAAMQGLKEDPKISIADIRIQDIKAMEGVFLIKLRVINPNNVPLDVNGINCELEIGERRFANGIAESNQVVPAFGTTTIPVDVYASVLDIIAATTDLLRSSGAVPSQGKPLPYTLKGTVTVGVRGFQKQVPFKSSGELSLNGLGLPF